jgi:hypothetical protein
MSIIKDYGFSFLYICRGYYESGRRFIIFIIIIIILFNNKAIAEAEADNDVLSEQHTEPQKKKPGRKPLTNTPSSVSFSISLCIYF